MRVFIVAAALVPCFLPLTLPTAQPPAKVDFVRDVQPILQAHCIDCHGPEKQMNGFRLDRRRDALRGGTITVIAPGNAQASRLYLRLTGTRYGRQMPVDDHLTPDQIDTIKRWLDEGAEWPDAASGEPPAVPPDPAAVRAFDAIRAGDTAAFSSILRTNPKVSAVRGPSGITPLMAASLYGDAALVKTVLDLGADPNVADDAGATPLMWAVDDLEKTRLLVEHGADVSAMAQSRRTPIVIAASFRGNAAVVRYLLDHGANPSARVPGLIEPVTPLAEAAKQGDEPMMRLLVERGANVKDAGVTPFALSLRARCDGCVGALATTLPPPVTPAMLLAAPPLGPALATPALLERGADANAAAAAGYPILLLAAASDAQPVDAVQALIARGANVNARGPNGETALSLARQHGRSPLVKMLLDAGATDTPADPPAIAFAPAHSPAAAVARSLPRLQRADATFLQKAGCVSCHHNTYTAETVALAKRAGVPFDAGIANAQGAKVAAYVDEWRERNLQGQGVPGDHDSMSPILIGLAAAGYPANAATDAMARFIQYQQAADGHWPVFAHRPPIESSDLQATVIAMRALQLYAPLNRPARVEADLRKAAAWVASAQPASTQDRMYQLRGLHWTGAPAAAVGAAARALAAEQRPDGGWAQLPTLESDAYATGQALVALLDTGAMRPAAPAVRRGVAYLLKTQLADGSWFVPSRAIPLQPYFDAGFPHGKDQFISAAATNWATQALILAECQGKCRS